MSTQSLSHDLPASIRRIGFVKPIFFALVVLEACSCGVVNVPLLDDLTLVSVEVVNESDIPKQDKDWEPGWIPMPLFRATFSSSSDIEHLAKLWDSNIDNKISVCDGQSIDTKQLVGEGFPDVLDKFGRIDNFRRTNPSSRTGNSASSVTLYRVYFDIRRHRVSTFHDYDLVREPQDICFRVNGLNETTGLRFHSNTIVITKQALVAALRRAGLE